MSQLTEGDKAPDFDLAGPDGTRVKLGDFHGRPVVVYFYPKDNTPACTLEGIDFSTLADEFAAHDTIVIGISPDSPRVHGSFCQRFDLKIVLASDPDHETAERYGAWGEKSMFGRSYLGFIRTTFLIGPNGRIARVWPKVRVAGHANEVLAAAANLKRS